MLCGCNYVYAHNWWLISQQRVEDALNDSSPAVRCTCQSSIFIKIKKGQ